MTLKLFRSPNTLAIDQAFQGTRYELATNWYGAPAKQPLEVFLSLEPDSLLIGWRIAIPPSGFQTLRQVPQFGDFTEGLWEAEVFELFLFHTNEENYLEVNLAPSGAWWSRSFDAYRKASAEERPRATPEIFREQESSTLKLAIKLPRSDFQNSKLEFPPTRINLTAILSREHLSLAQPRTAWPDFHLPWMDIEP